MSKILDMSARHRVLAYCALQTFPHLLGRAIFTEDISTVATVMLPIGQSEASAAGGAVCHLSVILPFPARLLHQLHLLQNVVCNDW